MRNIIIFGLMLVLPLSFTIAMTDSDLLKISPDNGRYMSDQNNNSIWMRGLHTWPVFQDCTNASTGVNFCANENLSEVFNWTAFVDYSVDNNYNFIRGWIIDYYITGGPNKTMEFETAAWARNSSDGNGTDGQAKFDLTIYNQTLFDQIKERVAYANESGIYVSIMLFQGWSTSPKISGHEDPWPYHPFNVNNNIQRLDGSRGGQGWDLYRNISDITLTYQKAYVEKMIDTLHMFDNIVWQIDNELDGDAIPFMEEIASHIRSYEQSQGYTEHLVWLGIPYYSSGLGDGAWDDQLMYDSNADVVSTSLDPKDGCVDPCNDIINPPIAPDTKPCLHDTDHMGGYPWDADDHFIFNSLIRGYNPIYMSWWPQPYFGSHTQELLARPAMTQTGFIADKLNLNNLEPNNTITNTDYSMIPINNIDPEYIVYSENAQSNIEFNISEITNEVDLWWFNPTTNATRLINSSTYSTGTLNLTAPNEFTTGRSFIYLGNNCPFDEWYYNSSIEFYPKGCIKYGAGWQEEYPSNWHNYNSLTINLNRTEYNRQINNIKDYISSNYMLNAEYVNLQPQDINYNIHSGQVATKIKLDNGEIKTLIMSKTTYQNKIIG